MKKINSILATASTTSYRKSTEIVNDTEALHHLFNTLRNEQSDTEQLYILKLFFFFFRVSLISLFWENIVSSLQLNENTLQKLKV